MPDLLILRRWLIWLVLALAVFNLCWERFSRIDVKTSQALDILALVAALALAVVVTGRMSIRDTGRASVWRLLQRLSEGGMFLVFAWSNLRLFNHITFSVPMPLADDLLIDMDRWFGFDWTAYFDLVMHYPTLIWILDLSYGKLDYVSAAALLLLLLIGSADRSRFFIEAFFVTAIIAASVGWILPAKAAVATLIGDVSAVADLPRSAGTYHLSHMDRLRNPVGDIRLDLFRMPGLITFPSFHTAAGVVIAFAFWRTLLFVPAALYSATMIAATPIFGGHYFVDLIVGALLAAAVIAALLLHPQNREIFARPVLAAPDTA
ncbi:MAG: phosphatase PAP2 family protein [Tabrizicola sp.]|nr:phosphatase PAP2 family protein [Tabrizicola sp.]